MKHIAYLVIALWPALLAAQPRYTVAQLTDSALAHNIAMREARHNIEAAERQRQEAFTKYFPTVSGTAGWFQANKGLVQADVNPSELVPEALMPALSQALPAEALAALASPVSVELVKHGKVAGVTAMQPVFAGGRIVNGNRLARVGEQVSRLQLELQEHEVESTVQHYALQLVALNEKARTLTAAQDLLAGVHRDVEAAVGVGVALRNDLLQVQLRENELESQRLTLDNGISLVKMLLAQYCALADTAFVLDEPATAPVVPERRDHRQALTGTAAYRLLDKGVEAAELQQKMERGKLLPSLAVGAGYNYNDLSGKGVSLGMVFATVSVPITDWWGGSKAVQRKRVDVIKAQERLDDSSEVLLIGMQKAWNDLDEACRQLAIAERSIEQAEENLRLNRDYYRAGVTKMSDLLEAQLLNQQAHDRRTDAWVDCRNKLLAYRLATE